MSDDLGFKRQCSDCIFFMQTKDREVLNEAGECRRYPPQFDPDESSFPLVLPHEWCGEFMPKSLGWSTYGQPVSTNPAARK